MYSDPLREAIAEAEQLVAAAPHIETEADLLEGLQYLAGCIAGCMHLAFDYERDHPFLQSGTGPFTKMGLDNPDTLYFGTRLQATRNCHSTRSNPVIASVTGCSTCSRVFISMKKNSSGRCAETMNSTVPAPT